MSTEAPKGGIETFDPEGRRIGAMLPGESTPDGKGGWFTQSFCPKCSKPLGPPSARLPNMETWVCEHCSVTAKSWMPDSPAEPVMQFFAFAHLPAHLKEVSRPFCELAARIYETLPRNAERTKSLDRLLEAKDAAVRARLAK